MRAQAAWLLLVAGCGHAPVGPPATAAPGAHDEAPQAGVVADRGACFDAARSAAQWEQASGGAVIGAERFVAEREAGAWVLDAAPAGSAPPIAGARTADWRVLTAGASSGIVSVDAEEVSRRVFGGPVAFDAPVLVVGAGRPAHGVEAWGEEGRLALVLRSFGWRRVRLLATGRVGLPAEALGRPPGVSPRLDPALGPGAAGAAARPGIATLADVERVVAAGGFVLDTRSREEFDGGTGFGVARGGHLPGARWFEWSGVYDACGGLIPPDQLARRLPPTIEPPSPGPVDAPLPWVTYCTGGVRSAMVAYLLRAAGIDARNYEGSMWEWAADPDRPLEGGAVMEAPPARSRR